MGTAAAAAVAGTLLIAVDPAFAVFDLDVTPNFPASVNVGDAFTATVTASNNSTAPQSAQAITLTDLRLTPSCGASANPCSPVDLGVFSFGPSGTGSNACAGKNFSITGPDATGTVRFIGESVTLTAGASCTITFQATALKTPNIDALPASAGRQTWHVAAAQGRATDGTFVSGTGSQVTTVSPDSPHLVVTAPASGTAGTPFSATGTISGGTNPRGSMTFILYSPADTACAGAPIASNTLPVNGNGTYTSALVTPNTPGMYRWRAVYNGDDNNASVSTACNAAGSVTNVGVVGDEAEVNDFNGDGITDVAIYRPADGTWYIRNVGAIPWGGSPGDVAVPGDYNGDGTTDVAIYRPGDGTWYVRNVGGFVFGGLGGDVPVPGDYNGDGTTDVAIYRPADGTWYIRNVGAIPWGGLAGDVAVPADYNGDGTTDVAIYRNGTWFIRNVGAFAYGTAGDVPVPGNYDGDADDDIAVYRTSTGVWFLKDIGAVQFGGLGGDMPQPGNYDGDNDDDIAIYRSSTGVWYLRDVGLAVPYGSPGDIPLSLPAAIRQAFFF